MPIPATDQMVLPVLQHIADGREYRRVSILDVFKEFSSRHRNFLTARENIYQRSTQETQRLSLLMDTNSRS